MFLIVNVSGASQIATNLEPLWLATRAKVELIPVLGLEDLERGIQELGPNLSKYTGG